MMKLTPPGFLPLNEREIEELDEFMMNNRHNDEAMLFDMMDGYLHAVAIGPTTLHPRQWLPPIWGQTEAQGMAPPAQSMDQLNRILGFVMRHFNSIIRGFEQEDPEIIPRWGIREWNGQELDDAEMWAYGFVHGVDLCRGDWEPLLRSPEGQAWYRPIALLGEDDYGPDQDLLTATPEDRHQLALEIPDAVLAMHAFWLPLRRAVYERQAAQSLQAKVGRNDPCPCGSGLKFKKCCGAPVNLQ